jgi:hypothetical protein
MKCLQISTSRIPTTPGFQVRLKIRVLKWAKFVRGSRAANTRILDTPAHIGIEKVADPYLRRNLDHGDAARQRARRIGDHPSSYPRLIIGFA